MENYVWKLLNLCRNRCFNVTYRNTVRYPYIRLRVLEYAGRLERKRPRLLFRFALRAHCKRGRLRSSLPAHSKFFVHLQQPRV